MKTFVHVGIHKSGSTFLQRVFFPNLSDINVITFVDNKKYINEARYFQTVSNIFFEKKKLQNY